MLNARKLYKDTDISDIRGILEVRVGKTPDVPIFRYKKGREVITVTYGQAWRDIWKLGAFLDKVCPKKGNVALLGENSYFWIITYFATILTGRVIIPLDRDLDTSTLEKLISRSEAQVLVYSSSFDEFVSGLSSSGKAGNVVSMDSFSDVLSGPDAPVPPYEPNPDSVCTILFTSGTTGEPKGVMLTQRNIARNVINAVQIVWFTGPSVLTLPLHHSFPFTINVLGAWICGSCAFISSGLRHFQNELKLYHPENLALVPLYVETMYDGIWKAAREMGKDRQLSKLVSLSKGLRRVGLDLRRVLFKPILSQFGGKLKNILCGGADLDRKYVEGMDDFGIQILVGYGITECAPLVTFNRPGHSRPGSVGVPLNGCEVRISDGEILARSDSVMAGYYKDEEATAQALEGGWLHTGDLGYIDSDGYLYITGRKKNLIILSNGENVSPEELEKLVSTISGVEEVVIREEGKTITAEIYPSDGEDGIREAILQLNRTLPPYKRIQEVRFRNSPFERTTTRKIIRT